MHVGFLYCARAHQNQSSLNDLDHFHVADVQHVPYAAQYIVIDHVDFLLSRIFHAAQDNAIAPLALLPSTHRQYECV
jgi:hypothetical protein